MDIYKYVQKVLNSPIPYVPPPSDGVKRTTGRGSPRRNVSPRQSGISQEERRARWRREHAERQARNREGILKNKREYKLRAKARVKAGSNA